MRKKRNMTYTIFTFFIASLMFFMSCGASGGTGEVYTPPALLPEDAPDVFITRDISPEGLSAVFEALECKPSGNVAVKITTGEPPDSNYLRAELIGQFIQSQDAAIVECNTAYGGSRAETAMHLQVARDHGYSDIAIVDIMDSEGEIPLPVKGGEVLEENFVGNHFYDYDYYIILSHFKGHQMAGYGGAIKNASIGLASSSGKSWIHSGGKTKKGISGKQDAFLKGMAEAAMSVRDALDGNIVYINVMNRLSVDCDCDPRPSEPDMHDAGILASYDPVALDQACIDLVIADPNGQSLVNRINSRNGMDTLTHAQNIGFGRRYYRLVYIEGN